MALQPFARFVAVVGAMLVFAPCCAAAAPKTDADVLADLNRVVPGLNLLDVPLEDAMDFVKDVSGDLVVVDWAALQKAGVTRDTRVTSHTQGVKLSAALTTILDKAAGKPGMLTYIVKGGAIHIVAK
jgi:hypothetical protein